MDDLQEGGTNGLATVPAECVSVCVSLSLCVFGVSVHPLHKCCLAISHMAEESMLLREQLRFAGVNGALALAGSSGPQTKAYGRSTKLTYGCA